MLLDPAIDVLDLLLQILLQAGKELGILSLAPSPLNILWLLREKRTRRKVLREPLSRDHCAPIWLLISQDYLSFLVQGPFHGLGFLFILGLTPAGTVGSLTARNLPFVLTGLLGFCCFLLGLSLLGNLLLCSLLVVFPPSGSTGEVGELLTLWRLLYI